MPDRSDKAVLDSEEHRLRAIRRAEEELKAGAHERADDVLARVIAWYDGRPPDQLLGLAHRVRGASERHLGHYPPAREEYRRCLEIAEGISSDTLRSAAFEGLALTELAAGRPEKARQHFATACRIAQKAGNLDGLAQTKMNFAIGLRAEDLDGAERLLREAAAHETTPFVRGLLLDNWADALRRQREVSLSIEAGRDATRAFRLGGPALGFHLFLSLFNQAERYRIADRMEEARRAFLEARSLVHDLRRIRDTSRYDDYAARMRALDTEAAGRLRSSGSIERSSVRPCPCGFYFCLRHSVDEVVQRNRDEHLDIEENELVELLERYERYGATHMTARVLYLLGTVAGDLMHHATARSRLLDARRAAWSIGDAHTEVLCNLGLARLSGRIPGDNPLDLIAQARALLRLAVEQVDLVLQPHEARPTVVDIDFGALDVVDADLCRRYGAHGLAKSLFHRSIDAAQQPVARQFLAFRLCKLVELCDAIGDARAADAALARLEAVGQESPDPTSRLFAKAFPAIRRLEAGEWTTDVLDDLCAACDAYEELRAQRTSGDLAQMRRYFDPPFEQAIEVALRLGQVDRAFELLERAKARALLDRLPAHREGSPRTAEEIVRSLASIAPDAVLIELFVGRHGGLAFVLEPGNSNPVVHRLSVEVPSAHERAPDLLGSAEDVFAEHWEPVLRDLWHPLVVEVRRLVAEVGHHRPVFLVPYGALRRAPLHLEEVEGELRPHPALVHLPSASMLSNTTRALPNLTSPPIVAGDPLGDLPFSRLECSLVAACLGVDPIVRASCTSDWLATRLRSEPPPSIVHLACHADLEADTAVGLVLRDPHDGQGPPRPAVLDMETLAATDWHGSLVVLSACSSGVHRVWVGDEPAGLASALIAAGALGVVASHWPVPDVATAVLMESFYRRLVRHDVRDIFQVARSLAQAQEELRSLAARDLVTLAHRWLTGAGDDPDAVTCAAVAMSLAHEAAGNASEARAWEHVMHSPERGVVAVADLLGAVAASLDACRAESYDAKPFAHPVHWGAFTVMGTGATA